jgi:putative ABC transport system substrate-binding protein
MVASFARPGGNVTGVSCLSAELAGKRVDLLYDVLPKLRRIGFLYNPTIPGKDKELDETAVAARHRGIAVVPAPVSSREGLSKVFALLRRTKVDALIVSEDLFTFGNRNEIMALAAKERLPDISAYREFVEAGGVLSYGASLVERSRQFGRYAGRVLRGAKPADLPIDQPTRFEFVVNLPAARAMGLTVPPSVLQRADDVIR